MAGEFSPNKDFIVSKDYNRPSSLFNYNNEGIAVMPESECVNSQKILAG